MVSLSASSRRASVIWVCPACTESGENGGRLQLTGFRRLCAENIHPTLREGACDRLWRVRFENHALKAFGPADSERCAGFELFVQDRGGEATGVAQKRPFDLGVLRIKGSDSLEGIERADAEECELRTQRLDVGQGPASYSRADFAADATSNQPKRDLTLCQQGRGDRRIMRRHRKPKIVRKSLHRREVCRARIDEEQRVRSD